ncbi:hypothetical protein DL769_002484 [Monosporascus sp. CRB-8-3]|nr:hypothetical protein DL769_002484 [Monosporascus sp. CRB-8-3]
MAFRILNNTYTKEFSDDTLLRVVQAWANKNRLATMFIGLNDNLRRQWIRSFEGTGDSGGRNRGGNEGKVLHDNNEDIPSSSSTEGDGSDGNDTDMEV